MLSKRSSRRFMSMPLYHYFGIHVLTVGFLGSANKNRHLVGTRRALHRVWCVWLAIFEVLFVHPRLSVVLGKKHFGWIYLTWSSIDLGGPHGRPSTLEPYGVVLIAFLVHLSAADWSFPGSCAWEKAFWLDLFERILNWSRRSSRTAFNSSLMELF